MEVINENFYQVLPEIEQAIDDAIFIAIDGEFTGLHNGTMVSVFDTSAQYYQKLRSNCMDFLMVQFGLCAVKYNANIKKFTYKAYNFYTFPKPMSRYAPDCRFLCQSSSMEFLSNHNFDFNKLFKNGIPFLTIPDEQVLRDELLNRYKQNCSQSQTPSKSVDVIPIPDNHKADIETACERVKELLEGNTSSEVIVAEKTNSFIRKLIYQEVYQRFSDTKVSLQSKIMEDSGNVMIAYKGRSKELMAKERMERELAELEKAVGFSAVLKKIKNSNKPIIGHNMTLDVCHMIHQFCLPLPSDYMEFQEVVKIISPCFYDTKYISGTDPLREYFNSTVLNDLHKILFEQNHNYTNLEPESPLTSYAKDECKAHEAAYDAYLTSSVFINLCNLLGMIKKTDKPVLPSSPCLKSYMNKLFMIRYNEDPCLNLGGPESQIQRNHVYHITFPPEWKTIDITNVFSPFTNVFIKYINDTSAWVALRDATHAKAFNKILPKLQALHKNIALVTWASYNKINNITLTTKRKIDQCSPSQAQDNVDSSQNDTSMIGQSPEKILRTSKGPRVSKGGNISPILEDDESVEIESEVSTDSNINATNNTNSMPSYAQTLKMNKSSETAEIKTIFPVAPWSD
ncbi:poly(A)-specific ribonuclease PARN-like isoform X2 [Daktulosphaira vitifoliae]|uniref:poly(A)-specific ribonuclease PARN-like isoform X2 n=1 Tax=Daktulosphaira vitifoliae TaxID=58002 RepID=UPI0021A9E0C8|nr:poly(A)-specific ribonuclease PARN-like isoform X2 [Daktulosphaira vitifoliae]